METKKKYASRVRQCPPVFEVRDFHGIIIGQDQQNYFKFPRKLEFLMFEFSQFHCTDFHLT
jgi:hypothetical protein